MGTGSIKGWYEKPGMSTACETVSMHATPAQGSIAAGSLTTMTEATTAATVITVATTTATAMATTTTATSVGNAS